MSSALAGRTIVLTRPSPGTLADRLTNAGATVEHVPLIDIGPPGDGGAALRAALADLSDFDWLVVTSANGAAAVGDAVAGAAHLRLAAVGTATAAELESRCGRPVDLVPTEANSAGLLADFPASPRRVLVAQADRAGEELTAGLRAVGHDVVAVEAYATRLVPPDARRLEVLGGADVVVLASGSAVEAWASSAGRWRPGGVGRACLVVTIGRRTADVAARHGLAVAAVAGAPQRRSRRRRRRERAGRTMTSMANFPVSRLRRLRSTPALRDLVAETTVRPADLIAPLFVREGIAEPVPIPSLPGVVQHSRESLRKEVAELASLGIKAVVVFGVPASKDAAGSGAFDPNGIAQLALADLRDDVGDEVVLIADLCIDEYTDHGHCGVLDDNGRVDNDATLEVYAKAALAQARAGAAIVAPSGMMDGQVARIRTALDSEGFTDVAILAYAAKFASALYGPFRDAVDVTIVGGGDRKGYQQDWRNGREALREIDADIDEGADIVMVKPALAYLDVIAAARRRVDVPLAAYHVSGEYAMVKAAAANGWIDHDAVALEHLTAIKRAGADIILTYFARWFAEGPGR